MAQKKKCSLKIKIFLCRWNQEVWFLISFPLVVVTAILFTGKYLLLGKGDLWETLKLFLRDFFVGLMPFIALWMLFAVVLILGSIGWFVFANPLGVIYSLLKNEPGRYEYPRKFPEWFKNCWKWVDPEEIFEIIPYLVNWVKVVIVGIYLLFFFLSYFGLLF